MSGFQEFLSKNGPPNECQPAPLEILKKFENILPPILIDLWRNQGFCSYANRFIWITNPSELDGCVKLWLGKNSKHLAIARTGFGHLFLWNGNSVELLHIHYGGTSEIAPEIELLFNSSLCSDRYLDSGLDRKIFLKAQKKLGPLENDECFGYVPAIALGGSGKLDSISKVKLIPHLLILAELVTKT